MSEQAGPVKETRSTMLRVRVKPTAAARFAAAAEKRGISASDALREAVSEWTRTTERDLG